jgi:hypothetical protein
LCFLKTREREREKKKKKKKKKKEERSTSLLLKTDPSYLTLVIYKILENTLVL